MKTATANNLARQFNFSAGPSTLPEEVLRQIAEDLPTWKNSGLSVLEMSHRSVHFQNILENVLNDLREILLVPNNYEILLTQGGATAQNSAIPLNLIGKKEKPSADFFCTGYWSKRAFNEAKRYLDAKIIVSTEKSGFTQLPENDSWSISRDALYVHICTNETIHGVEFNNIPKTESIPLVADMSSNFLSRPIDVSLYGVIFGSAQKNMGIAGLTFIIVRKDLLNNAHPLCPMIMNWKNLATNKSMLNTPNTFAIYVAGLVLEWIKKQGGLSSIETKNITKSQLLYKTLDASSLYQNFVKPNARSRMNIPFFLKKSELTEKFLTNAEKYGLLQLRGHRTLGGVRASLYNAMTINGVRALVEYMKEFERLS